MTKCNFLWTSSSNLVHDKIDFESRRSLGKTTPYMYVRDFHRHFRAMMMLMILITTTMTKSSCTCLAAEPPHGKQSLTIATRAC